MDKKLSLADYETMYKTALLAWKQVHVTVPKTIGSLDKYQRICRVCGCQHANLVDLDKDQKFDFDPSICNYRMLFQSTSLQFQFHSMPDLPACICRICAYKVKIFFLLTRQFMIGQQAMRTAVTDFYRHNYGIEPPEQLEDRLRLHKQLALLAKSKPQSSIELRRSISADGSLNAVTKNSAARVGQVQAITATNRQKNLVGCQLSQSIINLQQRRSNNRPSPLKKQPLKPTITATAPRAQRKKRNSVAKPTGKVQCIVTPHGEGPSCKKEVESAKSQPAVTNTPPLAAVNVIVESAAEGPNTLPSKAQLHKMLQDRRKQWR